MEAMTKTIRLLIIDDHQMVRDGIRVMLESRADFMRFEIDEAENDEISYIKSMINEGANGYILKNIEPSQLVHAIEAVLAGSSYYSNEVALKLIDSAKSSDSIVSASRTRLTKRELEILKMIALEMTNDEIAKGLFISKRTVDTHRQNLLNKLHVKNTAGLIKAAYAFNLV
jgi:DNA-binding NarL/FixJ family response regulator